jgi:hypothetical protein
MLSVQTFAIELHEPVKLSQGRRIVQLLGAKGQVKGTLEQPVKGSHESTVHLLLSLQFRGVYAHKPVDATHEPI